MTLLYSRLPVPILEIDIMFLLKTAKVEVRIIDKHSKLAHCYLSLHIRMVVTFKNSQFGEQCLTVVHGVASG